MKKKKKFVFGDYLNSQFYLFDLIFDKTLIEVYNVVVFAKQG